MLLDQCRGIEKFFSQGEARSKLKKYRKSGPRNTTRALVQAIQSQGIAGKTLLDIGGVVGVIQHELLKAGMSEAVGVDASSAYIKAVEEEAERQGHQDRIISLFGDFVEVAESIQQADIVTLDRVICCYHDLESLVSLSTARAETLYGVVYPRDYWPVKAAFGIMNLYLRLTRKPFRLFAHPTATVDGLVREAGLEPIHASKTLIRQVVLYGR